MGLFKVIIAFVIAFILKPYVKEKLMLLTKYDIITKYINVELYLTDTILLITVFIFFMIIT